MRWVKKKQPLKRFHTSGGAARPTICADFQPFAPVQEVVETSARHQAAATLAASTE